MSAPIRPLLKKTKALLEKKRNQRAGETAAMKKFEVSPHIGTTTVETLKKRQDSTAAAIRKNANNTPKVQGY